MKFAFFGTSEFSVYILDELKKHNIVPNLIVASPDKPKGRKLIITPPPTKIWAEKNNVPVYQPKTLRSVKKDGTSVKEPAKNYLNNFLNGESWDFFLVASYGKIIPAEIFDIPEHKTLNIHPSLLPKYRGASPIQAQILNDEKNIGTTIMQIDEGMDTGSIIAQKKIQFSSQQTLKSTDISLLRNSSCSAQSASQGISESAVSKIQWPIGSQELQKILAIESAELFVKTLPDWLSGKIKPTKQDDSQATECGKIEKINGEIKLNLKSLLTGRQAYKNYLKIKAYEGWPGTYFFIEKDGKKTRIKITEAKFEDDTLVITRIIPEGKKEMDFKTLKL